MSDSRAHKILDCLKYEFPQITKRGQRRNGFFETLVATVLSQNTNDKNSAKAFGNLSSQFSITPEALATADLNGLMECLKVGGLYRDKAKAIKEISRKISVDRNLNSDRIMKMPTERARRILMQLPHVGPKTADVVLLFSLRKPTLPIDTHVSRVAKRLQLVSIGGDYEELRCSLQSMFRPREYALAHLAFISLGRKYCKARNPVCSRCPVNQLCPSRRNVNHK